MAHEAGFGPLVKKPFERAVFFMRFLQFDLWLLKQM